MSSAPLERRCPECLAWNSERRSNCYVCYAPLGGTMKEQEPEQLTLDSLDGTCGDLECGWCYPQPEPGPDDECEFCEDEEDRPRKMTKREIMADLDALWNEKASLYDVAKQVEDEASRRAGAVSALTYRVNALQERIEALEKASKTYSITVPTSWGPYTIYNVY